MEIIDGTKAKLGATIMLGGYGLQIFLTVLLWTLRMNGTSMGSVSLFGGIVASLTVAIGLVILAPGVSVPSAAWGVVALTLLPLVTDRLFAGTLGMIGIAVSMLGRIAALALLATVLQWKLPALAIAVGGAIVTFISGLARFALQTSLAHQDRDNGIVMGIIAVAAFLIPTALASLAWLTRTAADGAPLSAPALTDDQHTAQGDTANDFLIGGGMLALGVIITMVSISSSQGTGGRYLVTTGLIGVGLGRLIRGAIRKSKAS